VHKDIVLIFWLLFLNFQFLHLLFFFFFILFLIFFLIILYLFIFLKLFRLLIFNLSFYLLFYRYLLSWIEFHCAIFFFQCWKVFIDRWLNFFDFLIFIRLNNLFFLPFTSFSLFRICFNWSTCLLYFWCF
jgi:hypothetical protein